MDLGPIQKNSIIIHDDITKQVGSINEIEILSEVR